MELLQTVQNYALQIAMAVLAVCILCSLLRAVIGPRFTDRIISVNMIGTQTIAFITILALYLQESNLIDVAVIYCMISFLAVVVIVNIYTSVYRKKKANKNPELSKEGKKDCFAEIDEGEA